MKTAELTGAALNWAVAECENVYCFDGSYTPSTNWAQGGPIIEREIGNLYKQNKVDLSHPDVWTAIAYVKTPDGTSLYYCDGPTPLIAAMRCRVASKLGDDIEIPKELT